MLSSPVNPPARPAPSVLASAGQGTVARPLHEALDLTAGGPLADIRLNGQVYSLRITRAGKLILTK